jgi:hypothetical protein
MFAVPSFFGYQRAGFGPNVDPDAQAFFDRVTAAGGTLSVTEQTATNQLVLDMKAAGIWTAMRAVYPMVGASAAACAQNLKSSSFTGTFTSGWTFASTGVTGNGTSAYMDTTLIPNSTLSLNSTHISGYLRTNLNSNAPILSSENASTYNNGLYIWPKQVLFGYSVRLNDNNSTGGGANTDDIRGLHIAIRGSSTIKKYRFNTTEKFNVTVSSSGLNTSSIYIAASRNNANYFNNEIALCTIGDGLTDTESNNFYTAVQAFQTTLSRNV